MRVSQSVVEFILDVGFQFGSKDVYMYSLLVPEGSNFQLEAQWILLGTRQTVPLISFFQNAVQGVLFKGQCDIAPEQFTKGGTRGEYRDGQRLVVYRM